MSGTRGGTQRFGNYGVKVTGLKDLRAILRTLDDGLPAELRGTNKRVVDDLLVPRARQGATAHRPASGYNASTGRSRYHWSDVVNSIRGLASQTSASIAMGSTAKSKGWMLGYEFGSLGNMRPANGPTANTRMFPRPAGKGTSAGYFFFPAVRQSGPDIVDAYEQALNGLIGRVNAGRE